MINLKSGVGQENLRAAFYRFVDQWLHRSIEATGIVIVARTAGDGYDVLYQSRWSARSTWPVAFAAQVAGSVIIDGFAAEPLRSGGRHVGGLLVARPNAEYDAKQLAQIRDAAEIAAAIVAALPATPGDQRQEV